MINNIGRMRRWARSKKKNSVKCKCPCSFCLRLLVAGQQSGWQNMSAFIVVSKFTYDQHASGKVTKYKPPAIKQTWYPASMSLAKLLGILTANGVNAFECHQPIPTSPTHDDDPRTVVL